MKCPRCGHDNFFDATHCVSCDRELSFPKDDSDPGSTAPPNHLIGAILVTVLLCLPFGIPAIVYASQVDCKHEAGDYEGARKSSKSAAMWIKIALIGALFNIILFLSIYNANH